MKKFILCFLFAIIYIDAHASPLACIHKKIQDISVNKKCSEQSDFMMSCDFYPESKDYIAHYHEEVGGIVTHGYLEFTFDRYNRNTQFLKDRFQENAKYCDCTLYGHASDYLKRSGKDYQKILCGGEPYCDFYTC